MAFFDTFLPKSLFWSVFWWSILASCGTPCAMKISLIPKPHILLATDRGELLLQLATLLSDTRAEISITHSPEAFLSLASSIPYDLIITTFGWSLLGPNPLVGRLRSEGYNPSVFVLLDEADEELACSLTMALLHCGVAQVLSLPLSARRLHRKVRKFLDARSEKHTSSIAQKLSY